MLLGGGSADRARSAPIGLGDAAGPLTRRPRPISSTSRLAEQPAPAGRYAWHGVDRSARARRRRARSRWPRMSAPMPSHRSFCTDRRALLPHRAPAAFVELATVALVSQAAAARQRRRGQVMPDHARDPVPLIAFGGSRQLAPASRSVLAFASRRLFAGRSGRPALPDVLRPSHVAVIDGHPDRVPSARSRHERHGPWRGRSPRLRRCCCGRVLADMRRSRRVGGAPASAVGDFNIVSIGRRPDAATAAFILNAGDGRLGCPSATQAAAWQP